jgi:membrane-associated protein
MGFIEGAMDVVLHIDAYLAAWSASLGPWLYAVLFFIIFSETGFVVTPFLPGDSLLFAVGALCSIPESNLDVYSILFLLVTAGILGNVVNYFIGYKIGPKIFDRKNPRFFNRAHLMRAHGFYEKHGAITIVVTRFIPILRTFSPFVAGVCKMSYKKFLAYNVLGSALWVSLFTVGGFVFGNLPSVKNNFHIVIGAIVIISFVPVAVELIKQRKTT